jgi:hypothetical protein
LLEAALKDRLAAVKVGGGFFVVGFCENFFECNKIAIFFNEHKKDLGFYT